MGGTPPGRRRADQLGLSRVDGIGAAARVCDTVRVTLPPDPVSAPPSAPITVVPPLRPAVPPVPPPPPGYFAPAGWVPPSGPPPVHRGAPYPPAVVLRGPAPRPAPRYRVPTQPSGAGRVPPPPGWRPVQPPPAYRPPVPPALAPNGQPLASFADRLGAYLLDRLIISAVVMVPGFVLAFALLVPAFLDDVRAREQAANAGEAPPDGFPGTLFGRYLIVLASIALLQFVVSYLYDVTYQARRGQTIGKRVLRIRAQALDGTPMTRGTATLRWLVTLGNLVVPGFSYLDGLWQLWDRPLQQCLHDKAAQTVVVKL